MRRIQSAIEWWSAALTFRYGVVVPVDHPFYVEIGRRLRAARIELGITQVDLGSAVDLSRTSITNIELGNQQPSLYAFVRMCDVLGKSPAELLKDLPVNGDLESPRFPDDVPEVTRETLTNLSRKVLSGAGS
jgi:transcriptional regulator with XRE-family HTH domain